MHDFSTSFRFENEQSVMADRFYQEIVGVEHIIRFNTGSPRDMEFQRADIDVQLHAKGRSTNVSEKFRKKTFDDLLLELYSLFPDTSGWFFRSEASHLVCFMPDVVHWIDEKSLHSAYVELLPYLRIEPQIKSLINNLGDQSGRTTVPINLGNKNYMADLIKARNKGYGRNYDTISISLPFSLLDFLGVQRREYRF
jgi:hypothetical protein